MKISIRLLFSAAALFWAALFFSAGCRSTPAETAQERWVWHYQQLETIQSLHGVWGTSATDVYAVGEGGMIARFDGRTWRPQVSGTFETLRAVWGTSATDVYAVGDRGTIMHSDGGHWRPVAPAAGLDCDFRAIWAASATDVYVVGGRGLTIPLEPELGGSIIPAGVIFRYDGGRWSRQQPSGHVATLTTVWGTSANDVYAGGAGGVVLHFDGSAWSQLGQPLHDVWGQLELHALWGSSPDDLYAAAIETIRSLGQGEDDWGSTITVSRLFHYDGKAWNSHGRGNETLLPFKPVWIKSPTDVYAVAGNATLVHFDGTEWSMVAMLPPAHLNALWVAATGDVFAVGPLGTIIRGSWE